MLKWSEQMDFSLVKRVRKRGRLSQKGSTIAFISNHLAIKNLELHIEEEPLLPFLQQEMEETNKDLPDECWVMIFNRVDPERDWESLSLVCKRFLSITNIYRVHLHVFNPSTQALARLLQRFRHLKKIGLVGFPGDLNGAIHLIAQSGLEELEELDLSCNESLPKVCLEELGSNMKNLKVLNCSSSSFTDADLVRIAKFFPGLEELDVQYSCFPHEVDGRTIAVTDEGIHFVSEKLKRLRKIDISGNQCVTENSLIFLSLNCAFLEQIKVRYCKGVTEEGISFVLHNTRLLNSLVVWTHSKFESFSTRGSASFPKNLQSLCFGSAHISDDFLCSITEASLPLTEFRLIFCKSYTFNGLSSLLQSYQSLKSLVLLGADFLTNEQIEILSRFLPSLTTIKLHSCPKLSDSALFMLTQRCPLLSHLEMGGTNIGREEYNYDGLKGNSAVTSLSLQSNHNLSSGVITGILNLCPNIEKLHLGRCFQGEEPLDIGGILQWSSGITTLEISECRQLKFSNTNAELSKLQKLFAAYSGVDDEVLGMIGETCPGLVQLDLHDCDNVTEEGVKEVVRLCPRLRYLNLSACSNVMSEMTSWIVSIGPSLRRLITPAHLYPEEEHPKCFLSGRCLVFRGVDYDELI